MSRSPARLNEYRRNATAFFITYLPFCNQSAFNEHVDLLFSIFEDIENAFLMNKPQALWTTLKMLPVSKFGIIRSALSLFPENTPSNPLAMLPV